MRCLCRSNSIIQIPQDAWEINRMKREVIPSGYEKNVFEPATLKNENRGKHISQL